MFHLCYIHHVCHIHYEPYGPVANESVEVTLVGPQDILSDNVLSSSLRALLSVRIIELF